MMKKAFTLCLSSVMLFSASVFGQITFTANDLPSIGTTLTFTNDTSATGASAGPAGANQTWNLTGYNQITTTDINYVNPASTPFAGDFPTATIATEISGAYFYNIVTGSQNQLIGTGGTAQGVTLAIPFSPTLIQQNYPVNMGDNLTDNYGFDVTFDGSSQGVENIRIKRVATRTAHVDGYGTLITPLGQYQCLREKVDEDIYDSVWAETLFGWSLVDNSHTTPTSYNWIAKETMGTAASLSWDAQNEPTISWSTIEPAPIADFSTSVSGGTVSFTENTTNNVTAYLWDFGDGSTSTQANPTHTYPASGTYTACLTVTNASGSDSYCQSVTVTVGTPTCDRPDGITVTFNGSLTTFSWDLNPNATGTQIQYRVHPSVGGGGLGTAVAGAGAVSKNVNDITCGMLHQSRTRFNCSGTLSDWKFKNFNVPACRLADENQGAIHMWPNPVENVLNISQESTASFGEIRIYDAIGNNVLLLPGKEDVRSMDIDVSNLQPGLYFMTIESRSVLQNTSFVKL